MQTVKGVKEGQAEFLVPDVYDASMLDGIPLKETYTYEDYAKLPEGAPYQLIGGQLVMTPSPTPYHQEISQRLEFKILSYIEKNHLGRLYHAPLDVLLSDGDVYQPDIIFISGDRLEIIGKKKIEGSPDIVIEILSSGTAYYDLRIKYRAYEEYGVREYWIVDPELKKIEVYENQNKKFKIYSEAEEKGNVSSKVLDKLAIFLDEIF
jgi:Uma2 family endonuclease